jgi:hypothetical protein
VYINATQQGKERHLEQCIALPGNHRVGEGISLTLNKTVLIKSLYCAEKISSHYVQCPMKTDYIKEDKKQMTEMEARN